MGAFITTSAKVSVFQLALKRVEGMTHKQIITIYSDMYETETRRKSIKIKTELEAIQQQTRTKKPKQNKTQLI